VSDAVFAALFVGIQALFIGLDLLDRQWTAPGRYDGTPARVATIGFLLAVVLLFLAIQLLLMGLAPRPDAMMSSVRQEFADWLGRPLADEPMSGSALLALTIVAFYLGGLADYLVHRFFNHSRTFWWTHEYHHLPTQVFLAMPGLISRPFSVFTAVPTALFTIAVAYGLIALMGWPIWTLEPLKLVALLNTFVLVTSHSAFLRRWTWPHHVLTALGITSPQAHLVHHSVDSPGNYGNIIILWDRVFGTWTDPMDPRYQDLPLGLGYDQDFLGTVTLGRLKLSEKQRQRWQVARYCNLEARDRYSGASLAPDTE
jgi:sterol desaturase/sphingolipid hydroxylase (fatty acid hydroxylase superfamily)